MTTPLVRRYELWMTGDTPRTNNGSSIGFVLLLVR
jgi:hypothetical protein